MKRILFSLSITAVFFSCTSSEKGNDKHDIKGKWTSTSTSGGQTYEFIASFKDNGTYDGILNGKVVVSGGNFSVSGDTIAFRDAVCNSAYTGTYRLWFHDDSVRFSLIADTCTVRREGTDGFGFKRKKE
jgi:hypothetical protein